MKYWQFDRDLYYELHICHYVFVPVCLVYVLISSYFFIKVCCLFVLLVCLLASLFLFTYCIHIITFTYNIPNIVISSSTSLNGRFLECPEFIKHSVDGRNPKQPGM